MLKPLFNRQFAWATAIMLAFIVYGSLFPFNFHAPGNDANPLATLLTTWNVRPEHFGNLIGNIFLYVPFGLFGMLAMRDRIKAVIRLGAITVAGAALCGSQELIQFYIAGRVSTFADIYPNVTGTFLGAVIGLVVGANFRWPLIPALWSQPVPLLLLCAFLAYRLFPYVPSLDLHQYWQALKPVVLQPRFGGYDIARYTVMWLVVAALGQALIGARLARLLLVPAMLGVLGGQVVIIHNNINAPELVGVSIALLSWLALGHLEARTYAMALTTALAVLVVAGRLQPFDFTTTAQAFGWIPFQSFMHGSMAINTQSFLEKFFLYGGLIWLLNCAGLRLGGAGVTVALVLLATSMLQTYLPNRSAEITDAMMALVIAGLFALITRTVPLSRPKQAQPDHPAG